jgi:hypothetical protein
MVQDPELGMGKAGREKALQAAPRQLLDGPDRGEHLDVRANSRFLAQSPTQYRL